MMTLRDDVAAAFRRVTKDDRGISFMVMMILVLMTGVLGVAALTMTGLENSMAGAIRMVEEGTHAAESCIGTSVNVIQQSIDRGTVPPNLIAPQGPVPAANAIFLGQEINHSLPNNPDTAVGAGNNPNVILNVNNYVVNGDIDFQFSRPKSGSIMNFGDYDEASNADLYYRIDCTAANAATGASSRVIVVYACLEAGDGCTRRTY